MAEKYINAYKLKLEINVMLSGERKTGNHNTAQHALKSVRKMIDYFPAADVAPVRHGRWIIIETLCGGGKERKYCRCSECNKANVIRSNYCPNCGAKMDKQ